MSEDRRWNKRVRLFNQLLLEVIDSWCRDGNDFPIEFTIASLLFLFSKELDPDSLAESSIRQRVSDAIEFPTTNSTGKCPLRDAKTQSEPQLALKTILDNAIEVWSDGPLNDPTPCAVAQRLIDTLVSFGYVTFHHYQTTRRDIGVYFGHG